MKDNLQTNMTFIVRHPSMGQNDPLNDGLGDIPVLIKFHAGARFNSIIKTKDRKGKMKQFLVTMDRQKIHNGECKERNKTLRTMKEHIREKYPQSLHMVRFHEDAYWPKILSLFTAGSKNY